VYAMTITNKRPSLIKALSCACAALILGTGCTAVVASGAAVVGYMSLEEEANFTEQNYAVADYMIQQASTFIDRRRDLIIAQPLSDSLQPGMGSTISKMIPERVGIRLSQLGYRMDLSHVATAADTNYLKPATVAGEKPDFMLSGTYTRRRNEMDVNMRIVDMRSGRVVSVYDYILPLTREAKKLAQPKPKIVRLTDR